MSEPYRVVSALPVGTSISRYIIAKARGGGDRYTELMLAEKWTDTPHVKASLELQGKAAVPSGSTTDSSWPGPLAPYKLADEALTIMRSLSILGALEGKMQRAPLHARIARGTGTGITGGWVAAGAPISVQATAFTTIVEEHFKYGVIVPLAEELVALSSPEAEATVRRTVLGGLAAAVDNQLLLPTVTASAGVNPASILNGATERITTGSTAATIAADLASMLGSVNTPGPYTWIMKPKTMYYISLTLGQSGRGVAEYAVWDSGYRIDQQPCTSRAT